MHRVMRQLLYHLAILIVAVGPLLTACTTVTSPPLEATTGKPLVEAIEAYMKDLPGPSPKLFRTTQVYDRHGVLLGEFWDEGKRYWVPLDRINKTLQQATIATEDKTFYINAGVDWGAIVRAVLQNSQQQGVVSGASTITQQLARNIVFPFEKRMEQTLERKVSESVIAQDLTQRFSKDQILEMYLNIVPYGHLAYGIEAAARTYFAKSCADLSLGESALLAALPQNPSALDPFVAENRDQLRSRQGIVLALMARNGYITVEQAQAAYAEPLNFKSIEVPNLAPHFLNYVKESIEAENNYAPAGRLGLNVVTTLDIRVQKVAEDVVKRQVDSVRDRYNLTNAALVALKPNTGEIIAMVGSADFNNTAISGQVNVTIRPRQPGSAIKPILYTLALSRGWNPADIVVDAPVTFRTSNGSPYSPVNYDGRFHGTIRLRDALANSYNVPAVKLLNQMGVPDMVKMAHAMGVKGLDRPVEEYGLALTLGGGEVTPLGLTNAFATLANHGWYVPATPIISVGDATGATVTRHDPAAAAVVDPRIAYMMTTVLSDNQARTPAFGANNPLHLTRPVAAKTGTTNDFKDNWTVGFTPYLAVGIWAGNSDGSAMRNTTGLTGAAPIFHDFFETLFAKPDLEAAIRDPSEPIDFQRPDGLVEVPICVQPSVKAGAGCPTMRTELFIDPARPVTIGFGDSKFVTRTLTSKTVDGKTTIEAPFWTIH